METNSVSNETRQKWREKIETIIDAERYGFIKLNEWEHGSVDSVYDSVFAGKDITFRQSSALSKIYARIV